ncbi:MAG TPA: hypothetical protein VFB34_13190 [Chloroflexota bacterium]|nr:hypothetical protein [Chloroflexota bacterium]
MPLKVPVEISLSDEDVERLKVSLGGGADIERIVAAVLSAGAREFLDQATGRFVPGGLREARLYRVFQLLQAGVSVAEAQALVASIFKETPARARGLVESAIARYDVELKAPVDRRVAELLEVARWEEDRWLVELPAGFIRDRVLEAADETTLADPTRAGRGVVYRFPDETYQAVRAKFGLRAKPKPRR